MLRGISLLNQYKMQTKKGAGVKAEEHSVERQFFFIV
jgi:hypothetical protein